MPIFNRLFKQVDNSPLIVFRIAFGLLMVIECWGAIGTGWVKETFVDPAFTFTFRGFEWTQFLLGKTMYAYFFIMGCIAWAVTLGYRYRFSIPLLTFMWGLAYFMQKSHYNNHYYFILIIAAIMCFLPANRYFSLDVRQKRVSEELACDQWISWLFIAEIAILYTYASIAKFYPGWINGDFITLKFNAQASWFESSLQWNTFADFLRNKTIQQFILWAGIFFDLLIIPLLLWKKTRTPALILALIFHITNSIVLHIGIFPYFALSFALFFYSPETIRNLFFKSKPLLTRTTYAPTNLLITYSICLVLIIHISLPLRHYFIKEDVFWTEEGHRMAWRMMLRSKKAHTFFTLEKKNGKKESINPSDYITSRQSRIMQTKPDMILQFVQRVQEVLHEKGIDSIKIYAKGKLSLNNGKYYPFINDTIDLTKIKWNTFGHEKWLLPTPENFNSWKNIYKKKTSIKK